MTVGLIAAMNPAAVLAKARNSQRRTYLSETANALERYKVIYGTYPVTATWCGATGSYWAGGCADPTNYIPGLTNSGELKSLPQDPRVVQAYSPCNDAAATSIIYYSNGTDYKLLDHCGPEGTLSQTDPMADPPRWSYSWAIYTAGASGW